MPALGMIGRESLRIDFDCFWTPQPEGGVFNEFVSGVDNLQGSVGDIAGQFLKESKPDAF
jgi:hypothetical protein